MKKTLIFIAFVVAGIHANALDFNPFDGPKPIAVLIQTDPWLMVIGSDTPLLVIYEDGQVIYLDQKNDNSKVYLHKNLDSVELINVKKKLSSFGDYRTLGRYNDLAPAITDQPTTMIYLSIDSTEFVTSIYGLTVSDAKQPIDSVSKIENDSDSVPKAIRNLHAYLASLEFDDAEQWTPAYIEVMVWGYDYAPEESIHWPKDWPGLDSPNSLKRGDSYSIFLPGKEYPRLRAFLMTEKEKGAIEIGGKKWAASVRYSFPSEPVWRRAFQ